MKTLRNIDVAIIGGGWTGLLLAAQLGSRTSLSVAVLERGPAHKSTDYLGGMDELEFAVRFRQMQDYSKETATLRYTIRDEAVPIRQLSNFLPGNGTGGAGEHWSGGCSRNLPDVFEIYSKTIERYGVKKLPEDNALSDWGFKWKDIEPYYTRCEKLLGASGKAGNIDGKLISGGNPFEGPRGEEFPLPPNKMPYAAVLFGEAARSLGYDPYPFPTSNISADYTNPDGIWRPACTYCGFCDRFGCHIGAKAQPTTTLLPMLEKINAISIRNNCTARRIVFDKSAKRVTGVQFIDAQGEECFQPADLVFLASWTLNNTRLLLLSGIGEQYNPESGKGGVGRNLTHQVQAGTLFFVDKPLNRFMGNGAVGISLSNFDGDVFDHTDLPFIRGGKLKVVGPGVLPIGNFGVVPSWVKLHWGSEWKKAAIEWYDRVGTIGFDGEHISYKTNYMDLDFRYKDRFGDPLIRLTLSWRDNERETVKYGTARSAEIARAMGAKDIIKPPDFNKYDSRRYQSTHVQGGTIMGSSPETSAVNQWGQSWDAHNLFVLGGSTFPQSCGEAPTATVIALAYRTADAVIDRYLQSPALLS